MRPTDLPQPGDRIELLASADDDPVLPPGSRGTVRASAWHCAGEASWGQIRVTWDRTNKTIDLVCPPDRFRVIASMRNFWKN